MAIVPEGEIGQVQQEPLPGRAYPRLSDDASPAEFGAGLGEGIAAAGADVEHVQDQRDAAAARAQRQADQVPIALANQALSSYVANKSYTADDAAFKRQGPDAVGMDSQYLPGFDQQAAQIRSTLTPNQARAFDVHAAQERAEWNVQLHRYEFEEGNRFAQQTFTDGIGKTTAQAGINWRGMIDPEGYNLVKGQIGQMSEALAENQRTNKKESVDANTDRLIGSIVESGLADGGTQQMAQFLQAHKGEISNPSLYPVLQEKVDAALKREQAEKVDGLSSLYHDAYTGAINGVRGSENMISREQVAQLFPKEADSKYQLLFKAAQAGAAEKQFDTMDSAAIQKYLDAHDPRQQAAHPGQAQDLDLYNLLREKANSSLAKRQADPRQFAISTMHDDPIDWSKPDDAADVLDRRFNTQQDDSRRWGVQMPPLSKGEASQLNQWLQSSPPDQQVAALGKLRDGLDDEYRFRAVVAQLRPDAPVLADAALRLPQSPNSAPLWYNSRFDNDTSVAMDLLTGQELLHPKGAEAAAEGKGGYKSGVAMPTEDYLRGAFHSSVLGGLYARNPVEADQMYESFKALYAANVAKLGDTSGGSNATAVQAAVKALAPRMDHSLPGPAVPVPTGMDPARFHDYVRQAEIAAAKYYGMDPKMLDGRGLLPMGRTGSGQYMVLHDDAMTPTQIPGTNKPLIIDLNYQYRRERTGGAGLKLQRPSADMEPSDNPADDVPAREASGP